MLIECSGRRVWSRRAHGAPLELTRFHFDVYYKAPLFASTSLAGSRRCVHKTARISSLILCHNYNRIVSHSLFDRAAVFVVWLQINNSLLSICATLHRFCLFLYLCHYLRLVSLLAETFMRLGWVRTGDLGDFSTYKPPYFQMVQDRTKVAIGH